MVNLFNDPTKCCGCGACENICPRQDVVMMPDVEGFMYPRIDMQSCINCGLCEKVCPLRHSENLKQINLPEAYALYHKDNEILRESTSGGAFTAIAQAFCSDNYAIFGAVFENCFKVSHRFSFDIQRLSDQRKSKYVQSDIGYSFRQAKSFLEKGKKVLFSGTPCQIAGLKAFLQKDYLNLLTVEIICHGVPSPLVFATYLEHIKGLYHSDIKEVSFRDKSEHWEPHSMVLNFFSGDIYKKIGIDDPYEMAFYGNLILRPSCQNCPFATIPRVADFTIGDFWGVENLKPHLDNDKGLSIILANSLKSQKLLVSVALFAHYERVELSQAIENNPQLKEPTKPHPQRDQFMLDIQSKTFAEIISIYLKPRPFLHRVATKFLSKKMKSYLKKIMGIKN